MHPQAIARLERIRLSGEPLLESLDPQEARRVADERVAANNLPRFEGPQARDIFIPGPEGELRLRLYRPATGEATTPLILAYHGGGFVVGNLDTHDNLCRIWAARVAATVVAIEYRLAPEHPFPAAPLDCLAATEWVLAHAEELAIDSNHYALVGESSGGALASVVSQSLAKKAIAQPRLQVLIYPQLDLGGDTPSYREFATGFFFTAEKAHYFLRQYVRTPDDVVDPMGSPLRASSVAGLPPALIVTAGLDPLLSEAEHYAERLRKAGVDVEYHRLDEWPHGFLFWGETQAAQDVVELTVARLSQAIGGRRTDKGGAE